MSKPFAVIQTTYDDEEDGESESGSEDSEWEDDVKEKTAAETLAEEKEALDLPGRAAFKREHPVWKTLLRSKGAWSLLPPRRPTWD